MGSKNSRNLFFVLVLPALLLVACSNQNLLQCREGLTQYNKATLYFGTSYPDGIISDDQWQEFLDEIVTPNLPEGMTVMNTYGQWLRPDSLIVKEPGKVIIHLYPYEENKSDKIQSVIDGFKERFKAQSVIWEEEIVCVSF